MFPFASKLVNVGDLVFFLGNDKCKKGTEKDEAAIREAILNSSVVNSSVFHVGIIVEVGELNGSNNALQIVHAKNEGVKRENLAEILTELKPNCVELAKLDVSGDWKKAAAQWASDQIGAAYNDIFSSNLVNSKGERSFYCCQLVNEAYKATSNGKSPFLSHTLNFLDSNGEVLPFWKEHYKTLCPENPIVPQGQPGSHPSKLRVSPTVQLLYSKSLYHRNGIVSSFASSMKKFFVPYDLTKTLHFVNGVRVALSSADSFKVIEPRSGLQIAECCSANRDQVNEVAGIANQAQRGWNGYTWIERRQVLNRAANIIRKNVEDIAKWEVRNNGKSITEAKADILSSADTFDYYSALSLAGELLPYAGNSSDRFAYTRREPFGVVGAIGAWNYPFQTATWKICPAIACGNAVVYKPSPLAPVSPVLLASILQCAGLPDGVVNIVQGEAETGQAICECPLVKKVSFTGSLATGRKIQTYSSHPNIKPVTLELGGKSSCIILEDADLEMAINGALLANFLTQGEVCTNASRVLVHRKLLDSFTHEFVKRTESMRIGDPLNENTHVGAVISKAHMEKIQNYIKGALEEGATLLYGGERIFVEGLENGFYLSPCVLTDVTPSMRVYKEEIFGPVALIIPFDSDEEALSIANDTDFGLAAGIFTKDLSKAHSFASALEAGTVFVNTYNDVDVGTPFGGFKQSGHGRENGMAVINSYTQIKSVYVNASGKLENPFN